MSGPGPGISQIITVRVGPVVLATDVKAMWNNYSFGFTHAQARRRHELSMWATP